MASDKVHEAEPSCSRLHRFHHIRDDTDVTIHCEGQQFLCHRAILAERSSYFECMFGNRWTENVTGSVTFVGDHMKADTLLDVLKYIYVGNASEISSNIVDLLYAGDYLGVRGLEAHFIQNLSQVKPDPINDLWKALFSVHSIFNQSLISVLASCNLTERLKKLFKTDAFLRISFDHLVIVVTKLWRAPPTKNDILLDAIRRWGAHALDERKEQILTLLKLVEPDLGNSLKLCLISLESFSRVSSELEMTVAAPQCPSLYVYTKDIDYIMGGIIDEPAMLRTYRYSCEDPSDKKFVLEYCYQPDPKITDLRFVSVDNVGLFSMGRGSEDLPNSSIFFQFASENTHGFKSGLALALPPIKTSFENFGLCNLSDRGLYLLNTRYVIPGRPSLRNRKYDACKQEFSEEEVERGIFFFNFELDRWLPVPAMIRCPDESCMTVLDDNMVYVITDRFDGKIVQAYDHRMRQWQKIRNTLHIHMRPQSCVFNGSIYVSSLSECERYDPIAARWENVAGYRPHGSIVRRLISYENELWQFYENNGYYIVNVYEPRTATWSTILSGFHFRTSILDAVVWGERTPTGFS